MTPTKRALLLWLCSTVVTFYLGIIFSSLSKVSISIYDEEDHVADVISAGEKANGDAPNHAVPQQMAHLESQSTNYTQTLITLQPTASTATANDSIGGQSKPSSRPTVLSNNSSHHVNDFTCKGFFSVLSAAFVPGEDTVGVCTMYYNGPYRALLEEHSKQMIRMNTTLTLFTTWSQEQLEQEEGCHLNDLLPGIRTQQFDPIPLLAKHGFTNDQIQWMQGWHKAAYASAKKRLSKSDRKLIKHRLSARLADVWRVVLAKEYQLAYADLDMLYLSPHQAVYLAQPNIAVPVWADENGALEMQNSGFCLLPQQLDVLLRLQQEIIQFKGPSQAETEQYKKYTALGPNVFQNAMQEMTFQGPVRMYLTNCNNDAGVDKVIEKHLHYKFVWLHLDGRFRGANMVGLRDKFQELRDKCIPPTLQDVFPQMNSVSNICNFPSTRGVL